MDTLIRERNGKEEIWYSDDYLKRQIEQAYRAGVHRGIRVDFYSVTPMDEKSVNDLTDAFKKRVEEEYQIAYANDEVVRVG